MPPIPARLIAAAIALLLTAACGSPPATAPRSSAPAAATQPASPACLREGEACSHAGANCCAGMLCVGGDAGACMPAN